MLDKLMQSGVVGLGILIGHLAPPSSTSPTSKIRSRQKAGALTAAPRGIIPAQRSKNMPNRLFFTSSVILAVLALTVIAWGADSNVGTWKLNLDKSKYRPGPAKKPNSYDRSSRRRHQIHGEWREREGPSHSCGIHCQVRRF